MDIGGYAKALAAADGFKDGPFPLMSDIWSLDTSLHAVCDRTGALQYKVADDSGGGVVSFMRAWDVCSQARSELRSGGSMVYDWLYVCSRMGGLAPSSAAENAQEAKTKIAAENVQPAGAASTSSEQAIPYTRLSEP